MYICLDCWTDLLKYSNEKLSDKKLLEDLSNIK